MADGYYDEGYLSDLPLWADASAQEAMEKVCEKHGAPVDVLAELVMVQRERRLRNGHTASTNALKKFSAASNNNK